jgi:hypothetical protein
MVARLGWSLALGRRPVVVLRLLGCLFGLFLYSATSLYLMKSVSCLFALLINKEMALW